MSEAILQFAYDKAGYEQAHLNFSYNKSPTLFEKAKLHFGYDKDEADLDSWDPTVTPRSYITQLICNTLPYWHGGRVKYGGRTQRVINSLGGFELHRLMHTIRRFRANQFLPTVDVSQPANIWLAPRPIAVNNQITGVNMLLNASFQNVPVWRLGPYAWSTGFPGASGDFELVPGEGLFGYYAVRLTAEAGEDISLQQVANLDVEKGVPFTTTVWYAGMRPSGDGDLSSDSGPALLVRVMYKDGFNEVTTEPLVVNTDGTYRKTSITITPTRMVHAIEVNVRVTSINGEKSVIDVGGAQLEIAEHDTPWTPYVYDNNNLYLVYPKDTVMLTTDWGEITYLRQTRIEISDTFSFDKLTDITIPNRAEVNAGSESAIAHSTYDLVIDEAGTTFTVGWRIANNLIERYDASNTMSEVFQTFEIADLFGDGTTTFQYFKPGQLGVDTTYEALTVADDKIYVIVKETWEGKTARLLKVCSPGVRWDDTEHLESLGDVYLGDGSGTCSAVGLIDERLDKILITIDDIDHVVDLVWDSAARTPEGLVILRSDPDGAILVG